MRRRKIHGGTIGSGTVRSIQMKHGEERRCADEEKNARNRQPGPVHSALEQPEDQHRDRDRQGGRAAVVDPVSPRLDLLSQVLLKEGDRREPERNVDEEDPAPRPVLGEQAAERRADDGADPPHAREVPLDLAALGRRVEVGDDRRGDRDDRTGADPLNGAEHDQRDHAPRHAAEHGTEEEDADPEEQHRLAAEDVREPAVDRHQHRLREQIDREQPRELREPAEVADDLRDRGRDDRAVDRRQPGREHEGRDDEPPRAGCCPFLGQMPRRSSIASSRRHFGRTFTCRSRKTFRPSSASISGRAPRADLLAPSRRSCRPGSASATRSRRRGSRARPCRRAPRPRP